MMRYLVLPLLFSLLIGCGEPTSIQTGEVGRQLTNRGLEDKIHPPGVFRLEFCGANACPKLVRLQVNKSTADLKIEHLFLPKSKVDISNVQIGLQFQVKGDDASINKVFAEVRPDPVEGQTGETHRVLLITADKVYATYLQRKAPDAIVTALREKTVDEILTQVPEIAEHTKNEINKMLADAPVEVTELGFPNGIGEVPEQVIEANRALFALEANKTRRIRELEIDLAVVDKQQAVAKVRLENDIINAKTAGVSFQEYVILQSLQRFADAAENGTSVALGSMFLPQVAKESK